MRLRDVTFATWLRSHRDKDPAERWLRELYPWPVLAQVECDAKSIGRIQSIFYDGAAYEVSLKSVRWQPEHGTFKYRVLVESDGLGWHSRSFADEFAMCGAPDGTFVTVFHTKKEEPLEKIARAFFGRRWGDIKDGSFRTLAVSRFLAASIAGQVAEEAFPEIGLTHYPERAAPRRHSSDARWRKPPLDRLSLLLGGCARVGASERWERVESRRPLLCGHQISVQNRPALGMRGVVNRST